MSFQWIFLGGAGRENCQRHFSGVFAYQFPSVARIR